APERALVGVRDEDAREAGGPEPREVEARRARAAEAQRRQVPLGHRACVVGAADLVDLEAGEGVGLAVALLLAVVDPVVAEAAEVEVGEGLVAVVSRSPAGRAPQPDRRVRDR